MVECPWCGGRRFRRKSKKNEQNIAIYHCLRCKRDFYADVRRSSIWGLYGVSWRPDEEPPDLYVDMFWADHGLDPYLEEVVG